MARKRASGQPPVDDFTASVAASVRRLRRQEALSLATLSERSGVSRAMLSQVESGKTTPSIAVLWKIAEGLRVPFSALLDPEAPDQTYVSRRAEARSVASRDGRFRSRPLHRPGRLPHVEFYEITIEPRGRSVSRPHPSGTIEMLTVAAGELSLQVGGQSYDLAAGDAIEFTADQPHSYENRGRTPCVAYNVLLYP